MQALDAGLGRWQEAALVVGAGAGWVGGPDMLSHLTWPTRWIYAHKLQEQGGLGIAEDNNTGCRQGYHIVLRSSLLAWQPHLLNMRMMSALSLLTIVPCSLSQRMGTVYLPAGVAHVL